MRALLALLLAGCQGAPVEEATERLPVHFAVGTVMPGEETLRCVEAEVADALSVSGFSVTKVGVHHVNIFLEPDGAVARQGVFECSDPSMEKGAFVLDDSFREPSNIALPGVLRLPRGGVLRARTHVINTGEAPIESVVDIALTVGDEGPELFGLALTARGTGTIAPGTRGVLTAMAPHPELTLQSFFGHQHAHGTLETLSVNGVEAYRAEDWAEPLVRHEPVPLLPGDKLSWACHVANTSAVPLTWGKNEVQTSEMCDVFGMVSGTDGPWVVEGTSEWRTN